MFVSYIDRTLWPGESIPARAGEAASAVLGKTVMIGTSFGLQVAGERSFNSNMSPAHLLMTKV